MSRPLQEHDYIGLSEVYLKESSDNNERNLNKGLNLKATELRLGLPGSESPERENGMCMKNVGLVSSGAKRVFPDTINGDSVKWGLVNDVGSKVGLVQNGGKILGETNNIQSTVLVSTVEKVVEKKPQISAAK